MCHIKEVGYWFCFPVKHLVAVRGNRETKRCLLQLLFGLLFYIVATIQDSYGKMLAETPQSLITMLSH